MGQIPYKGHWKGWALNSKDTLGPDMTTRETHVHKITNVPIGLGLNDFDVTCNGFASSKSLRPSMMMWRDRRGGGEDERRKEGERKERGLREG